MATLPYDGSVWALLLWPYTNAEHAIPANFTRDDTYAERFLQGHATAGGSNGGGTHTHTFSHTHPDDVHTHSVSLTTADGNPQALGQRLAGGQFAAGTITAAHTHSSVTSSSGTQSYQTDSSATTASTAEPAFAEVIFIRPDDADQQVPQYAVAFFDQTTVPTGFAVADGAAESQGMDGLFIKGAAAASDPGADGGGGTHTHIYDHEHDIDPHSHTPGVQSGPASQSTRVTTAITRTLGDDETHDVELPVAGSGGTTGSRSPTLSSETYEPAHTELLAIERTAAGQDLPDGLIVAFTGNTTDLLDYSDWALCDGDNGTLDLTASQIKMTTGTGRIGTVGGSDNQTHNIALTHNHNVTAHTHTGGLDGVEDFTIDTGAGTRTVYNDVKHVPDHGQTVSTAITLAGAAMAGDTSSVDSRPPFRTALWIKRVVPATVHIKGGAIKGAALAA